MSYESQNNLPLCVKEKDVIEFLKLMDYKYNGFWKANELGKIKDYFWFDKEDYKSSYGVELSVYTTDENIVINTRTNVTRSYFDLVHQNKTIKLLKKYFGGDFSTDEGKGRCMIVANKPPSPSFSGCYLAFTGFSTNFIRICRYLDSRNFGPEHKKITGIEWIDRYNPALLSNSFVLPFLVSIMEDYWKSTYSVLLKYSDNKEAILKTARIASDRLLMISKGLMSVEEGFADAISFTRISLVCNHFKAINKKYDFAGALMKPYRRRKVGLFDSLEKIVDIRNIIVHEASFPIKLTDEEVKDYVNIVRDAVVRFYQELSKVHRWEVDEILIMGAMGRRI